MSVPVMSAGSAVKLPKTGSVFAAKRARVQWFGI